MVIFAQRWTKFAWYFASSSGAVAVPLLAERVLLQPILAAKLESTSPELFGAWVWLLNVLILVGVPLSSGITFPIVRGFYEESARGRVRLLRFATVGIWAIVVPLQLLTILILSPLLREFPFHLVILMGIAIGAAAIGSSESDLTASVLRVFRHFWLQLKLRLGFAVLIGLGALLLYCWQAPDAEVTLAILAAVYGIAAVYTTCSGVVCRRACLVEAHRGDILPESEMQLPRIREFGLTALGAVIVNSCEQATVYFPRIMIGFLFDMRQVGIFVAGTTVAALLLMPVGMLGGTFLSLLSGKARLDWRVSEWGHFVASTLVLSALVGCGVWWLRHPALDWMYPAYKQEALPICGWVAVAASLMSASRLTRPLVMRFLPLSRIIVFSVTNVLLTTGAVLILASRGLSGVAQALAFGAFCQLVTWVAYLALADRQLLGWRPGAAAEAVGRVEGGKEAHAPDLR